jgi:hypothetical protein
VTENPPQGRDTTIGNVPVPAPNPDPRQEACFAIRDMVEGVKLQVNKLRQREDLRAVPECGANITLAYRHLEDARMRMGKALQALQEGKDIFPR